MASIRKRPNRPQPWEAVWRDPDGRQRTKAFRRKVDATRFLATVGADMLRGEYVDPHDHTTLREFAEPWLAALAVSAGTKAGVASRLNARILPALGDVELRHVKPSTVQQWLAQLERDGLAASTIRLYLTTLSQILNAAVDDGRIARNPVQSRSVKAPRSPGERVDAWTAEHVAAVADALPAHYRGLAVVGAGCGLRKGEAFGLPVDAVDFLGRTVHVRQQLLPDGSFALPKRGKVRDVPLAEHVALDLAAHLERFGPGPGGLVFGTRDGEPVERRRFDAAWRRALKAAGLEPARRNGFHATRHYFASTLLAAGVSVRAVADWLGHSDGGALLLRVYAHVMPSDTERGRAAMESAFRSASACEPGVSQEGGG